MKQEELKRHEKKKNYENERKKVDSKYSDFFFLRERIGNREQTNELKERVNVYEKKKKTVGEIMCVFT